MKMILVMALLGGQAAMAATSDTTTAMHDCDCLTDEACEVATMEQATKTMTNGPQVCEQCGGVNMAPSTKPGVDRWCFECGAIRATDFARAAYESYATSTGGKTIDGREMPAYFDLPVQIRAAWEAARQGAHQAWVNERNKVTAGLTFGAALEQMKSGARVAREGWNGKGMWLVLIHPGNAVHRSSGGVFDMQPCIGMKTATHVMQPGWLASQADMLADDWFVVT